MVYGNIAPHAEQILIHIIMSELNNALSYDQTTSA